MDRPLAAHDGNRARRGHLTPFTPATNSLLPRFPLTSSAGRPTIATLRFLALLLTLPLLIAAADLPMDGPLPVARPEQKMEKAKGEDTERKNPEQAEAEKALERPHENAKAEAACRMELKATGASFDEAPAINDGQACGMDKPILLKGLPGGIKVEPEATVRCDTALQLARWMDGAVKPSLEAAMPGETISTLSQASAYVCRNRNGAAEGKISEHAFGNAIDIAGFTLKSGKTITIRPADKEPTLEGAFQRAITEAACLYFTTVLDPGSDAAHQNHLHLDVKERRGGYRYCW